MRDMVPSLSNNALVRNFCTSMCAQLDCDENVFRWISQEESPRREMFINTNLYLPSILCRRLEFPIIEHVSSKESTMTVGARIRSYLHCSVSEGSIWFYYSLVHSMDSRIYVVLEPEIDFYKFRGASELCECLPTSASSYQAANIQFCIGQRWNGSKAPVVVNRLLSAAIIITNSEFVVLSS